MKFISTRCAPDAQETVSFADAILKPLPSDGGLYVPAFEENLRSWLLYMNDKTSFQSIAGSITSGLIKEEFSPIISESIATRAFPFSPELKKLDDNLYVLELFHGPTGNCKDFGISYFASCLEHVCIMQETNATVLAVTNGETGASIVSAFRGKKHLKAVLLFSDGSPARGFTAADLIENGGNILPVEVDGTDDECFDVIREIYEDKRVVEQYNLTLANTVNIGRLMPMTFCYAYAFSRLKTKVFGDIYYSGYSGNYSNLVAGLYGWKFGLPLTGFVANCTDSLVVDTLGKASVLDSVVPLHKRGEADPANPSSLERLEQVFDVSPQVLRALVYPAVVTEEDKERACKDAFMKYRYLMDPETAAAYAASQKRQDIVAQDDGTVVLLAKKLPALSADQVRKWCGEAPKMPEEFAGLYDAPEGVNKVSCSAAAILALLALVQF